MRITTGQALTSLCPTADFSASEENDGTNVQIYWHDKVQKQPSSVEIKAEITRLQTEYDNNKYQRDRKAEYPDIGEQLDMLWHAMDTGILPKVDIFYNINKSIKDKYPKE